MWKRDRSVRSQLIQGTSIELRAMHQSCDIGHRGDLLSGLPHMFKGIHHDRHLHSWRENENLDENTTYLLRTAIPERTPP